jgi:hypothetical protein
MKERIGRNLFPSDLVLDRYTKLLFPILDPSEISDEGEPSVSELALLGYAIVLHAQNAHDSKESQQIFLAAEKIKTKVDKTLTHNSYQRVFEELIASLDSVEELPFSADSEKNKLAIVAIVNILYRSRDPVFLERLAKFNKSEPEEQKKLKLYKARTIFSDFRYRFPGFISTK